jgi:ATP-binding cassette subfamily B protein
MGFGRGLAAEAYDRQYSDRTLLRRMLAYFRPQLGRLTVITLMTLLIATLGALQPIVVANGVDRLQQEPANPASLWTALWVLLIGVSSWFANWLRRRQSVRAVTQVVATLATDAFRASTEHDLSFYDTFSSGKIASRITSDTQDFGQLVTLVADTMSQLVEALILGVVLVRIDAKLSLYIFALIPIVLAFALFYRHLARKVVRVGMRAIANVNSAIKETIGGIAVAKNFRQESSIYRDFDEANRTSYQVNVKRGLTLTIISPLLNTIGGVATAIMVYAGGMSATAGAITVGAWYLFLQSLDRFLMPVMSLTSFWTQIQNGLSASERVFALIDAESDVKQTDSQPVPVLKGQMDFEHVAFQYKSGEAVLTDFDLHIQAGETVALVGHTGAGKSSVVKIAARFYEYQSGCVRVDGMDIRAFELAAYRRQLGIVAQTPFLFSGSVAENIRYGRMETTDAEILSMASQIGDGEWLEMLPNGLETEVGERGSHLSMGQRQLVSLMRVLVQKPAIFILDEATASIDPFTEWQIQQALDLILKRSTSILIAHRLSTVRSADRIIVMENGAIIEEGSHDGLLKAGGHYADLYNTYFRHQSLEYVEASRLFIQEPKR